MINYPVMYGHTFIIFIFRIIINDHLTLANALNKNNLLALH